ncbi:MAG TPA: molecular chaperone DnaJ [Opitutae bacterium]|nr:molecular chaperone DnaJ [Opitutae bacterium]HAF59146.1 molecular chaperone DnaJ [Opitutae bacterium]
MSKDLEEFRLKVGKFPGNLLFRFSFAQKLSEHNHLDEALSQLNFCLEKRNDWMIAYLFKAKLEMQLGQNADAICSLKKTIELAKAQSHEDPLLEAQELLGSLV